MSTLNAHLRSKAPLFERLVEGGEWSVDIVDLGIIGIREVRNSVAKNLEYLLNTRTNPLDHFESHTTINYGIPDFTSMSSGDSVQVRALANSIQQAVLAFEPRLKNVRVSVLPAVENDPEKSIRIELGAVLRVEPVSEDVKFYLLIQNKYGKVDVYERE